MEGLRELELKLSKMAEFEVGELRPIDGGLDTANKMYRSKDYFVKL